MPKILKNIINSTLVGTIALSGLTACGTSSTSDNTITPTPQTTIATNIENLSSELSTQEEGKYIVGPVSASTNELIKAKSVKVPVGSLLYISQLDPSEMSAWSATSSDTSVAVFVPGIDGQSESLSGTYPSFQVNNKGYSEIVLTNNLTGQTIKFTIEGIIQK